MRWKCFCICLSLCLLIWFMQNRAIASERDAVVQVDGCTGFIVEGHYLVSAKHCRHPQTITLTVQGKKITAQKIYTAATNDGPVVYQLQGGPFESLSMAATAPKVGDAVYSLGYPGGHWARIEGEIIGGDGVNLNYTNHRIATGNSGGPLLNSEGKVIGVALHVDADLAVHRSGYASWRATSAAIAEVKSRKRIQPPAQLKRRVVVVFSTENCAPCKQLKKDVQAGHFAEYEFQFVDWNRKTKSWSEPNLYQEFWETSQPEEFGLSFPTIWVRGTRHYRVGYATSRRGGLLGWLSTVGRTLFQGIFGQREPPSLPLPGQQPTPILEPISTPPPFEKQPDTTSENKTTLQKLLVDLAKLQEEANKTKADLETFKSSGVIGKIKTIAILKSDKQKTLQQVAKVKNDLQAIRKEFQEHPLQFLWGLFGLLTGIAHKKFLN